MGKRIIRALDGLLNAVILIICAVFLLVSVYSLLDNYHLYKDANDETLMAYRPPEPAATDAAEPASDETPADDGPTEIQFISEKQVGWLQVYDTNIDYPVMQGEDNFEYLNIDPYGEFRLSGSIFMDYRNDRDLKDDYTVIHGHHMEFGNMFGSLDSFIERDFFDEHRTGRIVTRDESYALELFAVTQGDGYEPILFEPGTATVEQIIAYLKENAMIYTECDPNEKIVAMATCWGDTYTSRLLVFGTLRAQ